MKEFCVDADITVSKRIYVDAENEKQAKAKVSKFISDDPYFYSRSADTYVSHEITDCYEDD